MHPRRSDLLAGLGLLCALLALPGAPLLHAEEAARVIVVLDRGAQAKTTAEGDAGNAVRLVERIQAQGRRALLLALGRDAKGRAVTRNLRPTADGLRELSEDEDYAFRGDSDARVALQRALAAHDGEGPVDILLLGPFQGTPPEDAEVDEALALIPGTWSETAPAGSRILPVRLQPEALASLRDARGLAASGWLVAGMGAPSVKPAPFSPLALPGAAPAPLRAEIRLLVDVLPLGSTTSIEPVVEVRTDVEGDSITTRTVAGLHTFTIERAQRDGRTAALRFQQVDRPDVLWLSDLPEPLAFTWETLAPDVQLVGPQEEVKPTFTAVDVDAGRPHATSYRIQRSRSGPTPAWRASFEGGARPAGLEVSIQEEVQQNADVAVTEVRVSFTAAPAAPVDAKGTIVLRADGVEGALRIPYVVQVTPGRVALVVDARLQAVPPAAADEVSTLEIQTKNANAPRTLPVEATTTGEHSSFLEALLEAPDGTVRSVPLSAPFELDVDTRYRLSFRLSPAATETLAWPCEVTFRLRARPGVEGTGMAVVTVRQRQPRLKLVGPLPTFRLVEGAVVSDAPLRLRLDSDGGDGAWALALLASTPTVRVAPDAPIGWRAVGKGAGEWDLVPSGQWHGPDPGIFDPATLEVPLRVEWDPGAAPEHLLVSIEIAPKWGNKGFILVGLAAAALLLGGLVVVLMRPAPVRGTLLYTVEGLEGTVGRLDLTPVGRRATLICADERGRLSLDAGGTRMLRVLPTRVGGMLEVLGAGGESDGGRRLLVDGLSLRAGSHLIRFVSGEAGENAAPPQPVPDLLGEEFDLESGRIEALDDPAPE